MTVAISQKRMILSILLCLGALGLPAAGGYAASSEPLPAGVAACSFDALANDPQSAGLAIHDAPRSDAPVLGRLPAIKDSDASSYGVDGELPEFHVIGARDGWFLIEGAAYQEPGRPKLYAGRGWVDGRLITTHLFRDTLKKAPRNTAADVVYLSGTDPAGFSYSPYSLETGRILGCAGAWFEVELWLPGGRGVFGAAVPGEGTLRGWTDRSCTQQQNRPCEGSQFDYSWSPLPASVTECNFPALSRDLDPAGLNLREAPDRNAPVLGRLPPPSELGDDDTKVLAEVQVIGFEKGWFLVEAGPYNATDLPAQGPKPYTGRGWIAGNMLTTELLRNMLKQGPSETSADVVDLEVDDAGGNVSNPQNVKLRRILACSGDWFRVELALEKGMVPQLKSDGPAGTVRGWTNGSCTQQLTTCDFDQSRPWSPPAPLPPE
jgi:hypothetical protein